MSENDRSHEAAVKEARRAAALQIVAAVAKTGGVHDLGQLVVDVMRALRPAAPAQLDAAEQLAPKKARKARAIRAKVASARPLRAFREFEPKREVAPAPVIPHERGGRWPYRCPAHPEDIKHSRGDGSRLRCFENGQWVRDLTPVLQARGLTPAEYREKWGLPRNYPMQSKAEREAKAQLVPWAKRKPTPVEIERSIQLGTLISFEDGGHYKSLTRHLSSRGLTPETYRKKWGLPDDYPMLPPRVMDALRERGRAEGAKNLRPRRKGDPRFANKADAANENSLGK